MLACVTSYESLVLSTNATILTFYFHFVHIHTHDHTSLLLASTIHLTFVKNHRTHNSGNHPRASLLGFATHIFHIPTFYPCIMFPVIIPTLPSEAVTYISKYIANKKIPESNIFFTSSYRKKSNTTLEVGEIHSRNLLTKLKYSG